MDVWGIGWTGVAFYNQLINALVAHDITPYVTLFHSDMPLALTMYAAFSHIKSSIAGSGSADPHMTTSFSLTKSLIRLVHPSLWQVSAAVKSLLI